MERFRTIANVIEVIGCVGRRYLSSSTVSFGLLACRARSVALLSGFVGGGFGGYALGLGLLTRHVRSIAVFGCVNSSGFSRNAMNLGLLVCCTRRAFKGFNRLTVGSCARTG